MRLIIIILFFSATAYGQKIERYYDYSWRENRKAPFYYAVLQEGDSGWHREVYYVPKGNMFSDGYYQDSSAKVAHGRYLEFHRNGSLKSNGSYEMGFKHGPWIRYHDNKMMADSSVWINGKRKGVGLGWSREGTLTDSSSFDGAGNGVSVSWYDSGIPRSSGRYIQDTLMVGKWAFYHPNGSLSAQEIFQGGKKMTQQYFNEDGSPVADTANTDREASFHGDATAWRRYIERNLNAMVPAKNGAPDGTFTVAIRFIVNTDGTLEQLEPLTSHGYGMEEEVLRLLNKSPRWQPARQHNRLVRAYRIQPITFVIQGR